MNTIERRALARDLAEVALLRGEFTLRSGKTSSYYLDKYRFTTRPELLARIGTLLRERVATIEHHHGAVQRLAGAELGGIPLVTAACLETGKPAVFVRNERKGYGTAQRVEGVIEPGDRIVLIEDVATTGGQAVEAVDVLRDAGAEVLEVVAVIDRGEGARERLAESGVAFEPLFTRADLGVDQPPS